MAKAFFLGIDVSTTGSKALLVDENGVAACAAAGRITGSTRPDPAQAAAYRKAYPIYRELYPALKASFSKIAN
jgi:sugar (pentulose or hexulose) kinase